MRLTILFVVALFAHLCVCDPLIKVFCAGAPLFRGRADTIVAPGNVSGHVHKVAGGSNFGPESATATLQQVFQDLRASPCTTCSISKVDLSAYWHPDLFYRWPNGTLSLVPDGGLTIYYFGRAGSGSQAHPSWKAFPPGFRMISGNPFRRTFNASSVADQAISFVCLAENGGGGETNSLDITKSSFCKNGLRLQVHFPQCWDGVRLDAPDHKAHVAFPIERPNGGNCPSTHPVRIPDLFFEAFYSVSAFPHGDGVQRFVLAPGDSTGYSFHGDFLNGWDQDVLQAVLTDPSCDASNTNNGNNPERCAPITQYVTGAPSSGQCSINRKIPLTEDFGIGNTISQLPGCNAITGQGAVAPICYAPPSATPRAPATVRFHLKSEYNQKYVTCPPIQTTPLTASISDFNALTYYEVFSARVYPGNLVSLINEGPTNKYLSASGNNGGIMCNRGSASDWEAFQFISQANGKVAIKSKRNGQYITTNPDGTLAPTSTSIGTPQLFTQVVPTGGSAF